MITRIMVPTDGSEESNKAVGIAEQIARAHNAEVLLVRVIEPIDWQFAASEVPIDPKTYDDLVRAIEDEAVAGLARLQTSLAEHGIRARSITPRGLAASELLDCEKVEHPDLVVMATHGRSGLARFALGSIADRLVREGITPVLLVRRSMPVDEELESAVVMLDGSGVAEQALPIVDELAGKPLRSVTLFRSVSDPDDREPAKTYLHAVGTRLARPECSINEVVDVGDARDTIQRVARERDLVILATHGRGGFDRLRHGSVAEAVVREVTNPVLLVRAGAQPA